MYKLLTANLHRFMRDKVFWALFILVTGFSLVSLWACTDSILSSRAMGMSVHVEGYLFYAAQAIGLILAFLVSSFVGVEFHDGIIRNKLCVGYRRVQILLADFISCSLASLFLAAIWIGIHALLIWTAGAPSITLGQYMERILVVFSFTLAFCALYTVLSCLFTSKTGPVISCLAVFFLLLFAVSALSDRLAEPAMYEGMTMVEGQLVPIVPEPNPLYLSGTLRQVCEFALELLPTGQAFLLVEGKLTNPMLNIGLSLGLTVVILVLGCFAFSRKDLK